MKPTRISVARIARLMIGLVLVIGSGSVAVTRAADSDPTVIYRGVSTAVQFDVSPPLTELAQRQPTVESHRDWDRDNDRPTGLEGPLGPQDIDALVQHEVGSGEIPAPSVSFDTLNSTGGTPPDPVGAVGLNHYVVMANVRYAVYSKTGTLLAGPANINTLWSGFGGPCQNENAGDPIVLYDRLADRWILTQFTANGPTYFNCVAISQTPDPTGAYFRYAFSTGTNFPDYPKYGHWPDAYYISTREFTPAGPFAGVGAYALNRTQMIAGNPTPQVISFLATPGATPYRLGDGLLPADLDGSTLPPAGTPNFYIGSQDDGGPYGSPSDALNIWEFHVDFVTPANSTFTLANTVAVGPFDSIFPCSPGARDCIPQPGTAQKIDHLGYRQRPLHRAAYRNFGSYQSIVTNQSVEASPGISGIRWWEIRSPNSSPTIFQQGTYAPGVTDGIHRWMGSIAQDKQGNMALGFSASNAVVFPSVWYTGRLVGDALGTMGQGEGTFINGLGSQTSSGARWGDYTAMTVDPTDDCTFWYVNEYYPSTSTTGWRLRVGSFKFPSCIAPAPALSVTPLSLTFGAVTVNTTADLTFTVQNTGTGTLTGTAAASGAPFSVVAGSAFSLGAGASQAVTVRFSPTSGNTFSSNVNFTSNAGDLSRSVTGQGQTFADVPASHQFWTWIEALARAGITSGCDTNPARYCPDDSVTRGQMAVFLLKGEHGPGYLPPTPALQTFADVPLDHFFASWIYQLAAEGITGGCATNPARYCPDDSVTRGQMAVFLLKGEHGGLYVPPTPTQQTFADVPLDHFFASWIYQLAAEGITGGCATTPAQYCPEASVTRGQMAVFLVRAFGLPL